MDVDRLSPGEKIAAVSAVLLLVFMFFDWFGVEVSGVNGFSGSFPGEGGNAWDTLEVISLVLLATIVAALGLAVMRLSDADFEPPVPMTVIVTVLAVLSTLLVLYRVINPPDVGEVVGVSLDVTRKIGLFLGLLASAGIAFGAYRAMQEEGASFGDAADRLGGGGPGAGPGAGAGPGPGAGGTGEAPPPPPPPPSSTPPPPPPPPTSTA